MAATTRPRTRLWFDFEYAKQRESATRQGGIGLSLQSQESVIPGTTYSPDAAAAVLLIIRYGGFESPRGEVQSSVL